MKKFLRTTAVLCAVLCLSSGITTSAARADDSSELIRTAQLRLNSLGYYVGPVDGQMGPKTRDALVDFQRNDGLTVTGQLSPETYSRLADRHYASYPMNYNVAYHTYDGRYYYNTAYADQTLLSVSPVTWDNRWSYVRTQELPSRFAHLDISESDHNASRDYVVRVNGHEVLLANNQPYILAASQTYAVNSEEDAIIITAHQGEGTCAAKNYLLTVHRNGTFEMPREIGNCSGRYEAHVANGSLLVSFPVATLVNGWQSWAMWRYENGALVRV